MNKKKKMLISVVIPCYNESRNLFLTITKLRKFPEEIVYYHGTFDESPIAQKVEYEFILINDGSTDGTFDIFATIEDDKRFKLISYGQNKGKGYAVRQGVLSSQGEVVWIMDCDMAVSWKDFCSATSILFGCGYSLVYGSRYSTGSSIVTPSWKRIMFGKAFNKISRFILGINIEDTQCPCKVIRGDYSRQLFGRIVTRGFAFDSELFARIKGKSRKNIKCVGMLPITFENDGMSSVKLFRDTYRMFRDLLRIRKLVKLENRRG